MTRMFSNLSGPPKARRQQPRSSSKELPYVLDTTDPIEEERSPFYSASTFYPAKPGEVLNERYQIISKVGFGARSTIWLAQDLNRWETPKFVSVKIQQLEDATNEKESRILKLVTNQNSEHEGSRFVRTLLDSFHLAGPNGKHECLVAEMLREHFGFFLTRFEGGVMPSSTIKIFMQIVLEALDYLHTECGIVHTDLKPNNLMVPFEDEYPLAEIAEKIYNEPLPIKEVKQDGVLRQIHLSANQFGDLRGVPAKVIVTDFDNALQGKFFPGGGVSTNAYESPESILKAGFSSKTGIWSLGLMLWDFIEGETLLEIPIKNTRRNETEEAERNQIDCDHGEKRLAYLTALLGPAPKELIERGKQSNDFYKSDGTLRQLELIPEGFSLDSTITKLKGENKKLFIIFARRMLTWNDNERSTAKELLSDPWLRSSFDDEDE